MNTSNKNPMGFISSNPLLKNITEYLVEEADAEEEELLGDASTTNENSSSAFEVDKELNKVIAYQLIAVVFLQFKFTLRY